MGNRLKRVLAKFEANRSHPRGVNCRSKFRIKNRIREFMEIDLVAKFMEVALERTSLLDVMEGYKIETATSTSTSTSTSRNLFFWFHCNGHDKTQ